MWKANHEDQHINQRSSCLLPTIFIPFLGNMIQGHEERFSPRHSDIAFASKLVPSVMLKNHEALSSDQLRRIADTFQTCHRHVAYYQYERWWVKWHVDKDVYLYNNIKFCRFSTTWADKDLYPNVRMILFSLAIRPSTTSSN